MGKKGSDETRDLDSIEALPPAETPPLAETPPPAETPPLAEAHPPGGALLPATTPPLAGGPPLPGRTNAPAGSFDAPADAPKAPTFGRRSSAPGGRVKILFLAANASAERPLRLDEEYRAVERRLRATRYRDAFELVSCWALRPGDVQGCLLEHRPTIVHFAGHGDAEADLWLLDERGGRASMPADALAAVFRAVSDDVRLVVLNACFAAGVAEALCESVGMAIGMQSAIGDRAAIEFAGAFYEALGYGRSVREAFDLGVAALKVRDGAQAGIPQLLAARGVDATQVRFGGDPVRPSDARQAGISTKVAGFVTLSLAASIAVFAPAIASIVRREIFPKSQTPPPPVPPPLPEPRPKPPPALPPAPSPPGMARIDGGRMRLGSFDWSQWPTKCLLPPRDEDCSEASRPERAREVEVAAFDLDVTEVTNAAFAGWLNAIPANWERAPNETDVLKVGGDKPLLLVSLDRNQCPDLTFNAGKLDVTFGRDQYPVTCVTWQGASEYCRAQKKRLPTEAEWELSAKGSKLRPFPWGADPPRAGGVTFDLDNSKNQRREVGQSPQDHSPEGIYDLGGNVSEWVEGEGEGGKKVMRGGHWNADPCRVLGSKCAFVEANVVGPNIGFRCAREPRARAGVQ